MLLKLYALPSLYRQGQIDRAKIYDGDIGRLLTAFPEMKVEKLFALLLCHGLMPSDVEELRRVIVEQRLRPHRFGKGEAGRTSPCNALSVPPPRGVRSAAAGSIPEFRSRCTPGSIPALEGKGDCFRSPPFREKSNCLAVGPELHRHLKRRNLTTI